MHPIVALAALSWVIIIAVVSIVANLTAVAVGSLPYHGGSPAIATAMLCLALAIDAFIDRLHW
jgi:hypothetical protein